MIFSCCLFIEMTEIKLEQFTSALELASTFNLNFIVHKVEHRAHTDMNLTRNKMLEIWTRNI